MVTFNTLVDPYKNRPGKIVGTNFKIVERSKELTIDPRWENFFTAIDVESPNSAFHRTLSLQVEKNAYNLKQIDIFAYYVSIFIYVCSKDN